VRPSVPAAPPHASAHAAPRRAPQPEPATLGGAASSNAWPRRHAALKPVAALPAAYLRVKEWRQRNKRGVEGLADEVTLKLGQVLALTAENQTLKASRARPGAGAAGRCGNGDEARGGAPGTLGRRRQELGGGRRGGARSAS
jgi:hypothetical protein